MIVRLIASLTRTYALRCRRLSRVPRLVEAAWIAHERRDRASPPSGAARDRLRGHTRSRT
jgi:hypothetical protein